MFQSRVHQQVGRGDQLKWWIKDGHMFSNLLGKSMQVIVEHRGGWGARYHGKILIPDDTNINMVTNIYWIYWCFQIVMLDKTVETPLDCKEIKPVNPKGNQSWIFIGRTDGEAEAPRLWPLDTKSQLIRKDPDAGKDWRQEAKGMTEDQMVGWHRRLNGHECEETLGDSEGQGSSVCCIPWGLKESDMT